jgi:Ca2+-binding RTX toxin-like protein
MPIFTGDAGGNALTGTAGDDTLDGLGGDDTLIDSLGGNDVLNGGEGADHLQLTRSTAGFSTVTVNGGEGADVISLGGVVGVNYAGSVSGGGGDDSITLARIVGASERLMSVDGGTGDDTVTLGAGAGWTQLTLGEGRDRIVLGSDFDSLGVLVTDFRAGTGGDVIDLSAFLGSNSLPGSTAGVNPFLSGALTLTEFLGQSDGRPYVIVSDRDGRQVLRLDGVSTADLGAENFGGHAPLPSTLTGTGSTGYNARHGNADAQTINGTAGGDGMIGYGGSDVLNGADGGDLLFGDDWRRDFNQGAADVINGGAGDDAIVGGAGNDTLNGGADNDVLYTGKMWGDNAYAPAAAGFLLFDHTADGGFDTIDGGEGYDTAHLMYSTATQGITLNNSNTAATNAVTVGGTAAGSVTGVERLYFYGGSGNDTVTGSDQGPPEFVGETVRDFIFYVSGDVLAGGAGADILRGLGGNDILKGGEGADRLEGGDGVDMADFSDLASGVVIDLTLATQANGDVLTSIEGLLGSANSDTLRGDAGSNILADFSGGSDIIEGRGGDDLISVERNGANSDLVRVDGGDGNDHISVGWRLNSELNGGAGDDVIQLVGEQSRSVVTLGAGRDTLVIENLQYTTGPGHIVTDFVTGTGGDVLDIFPGFDAAPFRNGYRLIQSGTDTLLQYDSYGGVVDYRTLITFQNTQASSFTAANFGGINPNPPASYIVGTSRSETLYGTGADDEIYGGGGADALYGAEGNDFLRNGDPDASSGSAYGTGMNGGAGDDVITGSGDNDTLIGGVGADLVRGGNGNDVIAGGGATFISFSQTISVFGQPTTVLTHSIVDGGHDDLTVDTLNGDGGNDTLYAGRGDLVDGGEGTDLLVATLAWRTAGITLDLSVDPGAALGAALGSTIRGVELFNLGLTAFADTLTTSSGADTIDGGGGDDILTGGAGANTLIGGLGRDLLRGGDGADILGASQYRLGFLILQNDRYVNSSKLDDGEIDTVEGGEGNDTIHIGYGDNADGGGGTDTLSLTLIARTSGVNVDMAVGGLAALQAVQGGTLTSIESFGTIGLTNYDDVMRIAHAGSVYGQGGDDLIYGNELAQLLTGDAGNDRIEAFGGNDTLRGGDGDDHLLGGDGNDSLDGDAENDGSQNPVTATGADILDGGAGVDTLNGAAGDDTLIGGIGNDTLNGGTGTDVAVFSGNRSAYTVTVITGNTVRVVGPDGTDTLTSVERLRFDDGLFDQMGNPLPNEINGTAGADTLTGTAGADIIRAGDGDDLVTGGAGNDEIDGGAGVDTAAFAAGALVYTVTVDNGVVTVASSEGSDTLTNVEYLRFGTAMLAVGAFTGRAVVGTDFNDALSGGELDDVLIGGGNNDSLSGGSGSDTADYSGAAGAVTARIDTQSASNDGDGSWDYFTSIENLTGSAFNDLLVGDGNANLLSGGLGRDTLLAGGGNDILIGGAGLSNEMYGGAGDDTYIVEAIGDSIVENVGEGTDTVLSHAYQTNLSANVENLTYIGTGAFTGVGNGLSNVITGGTQRDVLLGQGGDDILIGGAGEANTLQGGAGNDTYVLDAADSVVENTGEGTDLVQLRDLHAYNLGANVENGMVIGTGDFSFNGNSLDNVLTGGGGNDILQGAGGNDTLNGGAGIDTVTYILATAGVTARLDVQRGINDGYGGQDTFTGIENLTGSNFGDLLIGNAGNNVLNGAIGNDTLLGFDGDDILIGGSGGGNNQMQGGRGDDTYIVTAADTLVELAGEGTDTILTSNGALTMAANIEILTFTGSGNFGGTGNAGDNVITGGAGHDTLSGMGGNDTLIGGAGIDLVLLRGVQANYSITAIDGGWRVVDTVAGRDGTDTLLGVERIRFSDGTVLVLGPAPVAAAATAEVMPLLSDKMAETDAFVLPALSEKGGDAPLVLPSLTEGPWIGGDDLAGVRAFAFLTNPYGDHALRDPGPAAADGWHGPSHEWLW